MEVDAPLVGNLAAKAVERDVEIGIAMQRAVAALDDLVQIRCIRKRPQCSGDRVRSFACPGKHRAKRRAELHATDANPRALETLQRDAGILELDGEVTAVEAQADVLPKMLLGLPPGDWRMCGLDPEGCDLADGDRFARLPFPHRVDGPAALRRAFQQLAEAARAKQ